MAWSTDGNSFVPSLSNTHLHKLEPAVYKPVLTMNGWVLQYEKPQFAITHHVYGDVSIVDRIVTAWNNMDRNLGVLLYGLKGSGKTVTAKLVCEKLNLPVVIVDQSNVKGIVSYLQTFPDEAVVFLDEYEKITSGDNDRVDESFLSIMDGVGCVSRKLFILTCNEKKVSQNLLDRPSRVRYSIEYDNLSPDVVKEILNTELDDQSFLPDAVDTISGLNVISVDVVMECVREINLFKKPLSALIKEMNIKFSTKRGIFFQKTDGLFEYEQIVDDVIWDYFQSSFSNVWFKKNMLDSCYDSEYVIFVNKTKTKNVSSGWKKQESDDDWYYEFDELSFDDSTSTWLLNAYTVWNKSEKLFKRYVDRGFLINDNGCFVFKLDKPPLMLGW